MQEAAEADVDHGFFVACPANTLGYNLVYFLAGLQTIPDELYEAADVDGAGRVGKFWHITIPGLREIGVIILFLAVLGSLQVFDLVQVLTGGGPYYASSVVNTYIYQEAFGGGFSAGGGGGAASIQPNVGMPRPRRSSMDSS